MSALKHSADLLGDEVHATPTPTRFRSCADRLQADGVDLAGYTLPQRVDDLEAARRALGYGRIDLAQRERGHAHGDDLRLAPPEEHPPVGDDRREPARATSSGTRRPRTSRSRRYADAVREGRGLQQADATTSPRR